MGKRIGIVGAGVAGLHLGLQLRLHNIDVTIISDRTGDQLAKARLPNTAGSFRRHPRTREVSRGG